ncbi:MAG TPA: DUF305 domain-containing protein [Solirubrobacteraceae bacterium]|nr:DUF305 domain-containing protein [Solirubrobacteraceae bacterium]
MPLSRPCRSLVTCVLLLCAVALSACGGGAGAGAGADGGGDHRQGNHGSAVAGAGAGVDRAFAAAMIPHHESAVEMARIARERAQSGFVRGLAADIIRTQQAEIETLRRIDAQLERDGVAIGDLGVPDHMQGMDDDPADLRDAEPFDRAFVDMMIPHHQGAIAMAQAELARGENPELKALAQAIIGAQQREIDAMNDFREREYGSALPQEHPRTHGDSDGDHSQAHPVE